MTQINLTLEQAMDAVFQEYGAPDIEPDEFTVAQYCERYDITTQTATHHLKAAVKAGRLTERDVVADGHRCKGYRIVTKSVTE